MGRKRDKRIRVTEEEFKIFRGIQDQCKAADLDINEVKHGWIKTEASSLFFKNPNFGGGKTYEELREELIKDLKGYSPKFPKIKRTNNRSFASGFSTPLGVYQHLKCALLDSQFSPSG